MYVLRTWQIFCQLYFVTILSRMNTYTTNTYVIGIIIRRFLDEFSVYSK